MAAPAPGTAAAQSDQRTESTTEDSSAETSPNQYYLKYDYAHDIDSRDAASTVQDEPAEEHVEAQTTIDPWDEAYVGHDYDSSSEYRNPCIAEDDACHEEECQTTGEVLNGAIDERVAGREFDFENAPYGFCPQYDQEAVVEESAAGALVADATSSDQSVNALTAEDIEDAPVCQEEAYGDYSYGCCPAYDEYDSNCQDEVAADAGNQDVAVDSVIDDQAEEIASADDSTSQASQAAGDNDVPGDTAYDAYDYRYRYGYGYPYGDQDKSTSDESNDSVAETDSASQEAVQTEVAKEPATVEAVEDAELYEGYDAYRYGYHYGCYDEFQGQGTETNSDDAVADEVSDTTAQSAVEYDMYDAYGSGYDHGCYVASPGCEAEAAAEQADVQQAEDSDDAPASEVPSYDYEGYDSYGYEYVHDHDCYEELQGCHKEAATDSLNSAEVSTSDDVVTSEAVETEDYEAFDYGYEYDSACEEAATPSEQVDDAAQEPAGSTSEPTDTQPPDYDMYEGYEYDDYQPYDESPMDSEATDSDSMPTTQASDVYDSYDVYDYDNVPMQEDVEATPEPDLPASDVDAGDSLENDAVNQDYYGRYPYNYGYGNSYDSECQSQYGVESESSPSQEPAGDDVTMQLEIDFQQLAAWGWQSLDSLANLPVMQTVRASIAGLRDGCQVVLQRVDLEQLQQETGNMLLATLQQPATSADESAAGLDDANVFMFEFDAHHEVVADTPVVLEDTPWVIEDSISGESLDGPQDAAVVEPAAVDPVSVLPSVDRDVLLQWAGYAMQQAKTTWDTVAPEFERLAVETLARVSNAADAPIER